MIIKYFNRDASTIETEQVYGENAVNWLYDSTTGKALSRFLVRPVLSQLYGSLQSSSMSKKKVLPFIEKFSIQMDEFLPEEGRTKEEPYSSFNQFFIRRFREGARPFNLDTGIMPAPCEARYFGYKSLGDDINVPVKGSFLDAAGMVEHEKWGEFFSNGPAYIARLCPVDYHRFHYPDDGELLDTFRRGGVLHSVNPLALRKKPDIFLINERQVSIFETKNFGKLAYIEVGAICVGKIVQTNGDKSFKRGDEKGYFLFGGSTVIVIGEQGKWSPSEDILKHTEDGMETYLKLGAEVGKKSN